MICSNCESTEFACGGCGVNLQPADAYTAAEVKVLTEDACKFAAEAGRLIGRAEAADEIAAKCLRRAQLAERVPEGERSGVREGMVVTWLAAQKLALDISLRASDAVSDERSGGGK